METLELTESTVNPGRSKVSTYDFELLKVLGKGGYGKVTFDDRSEARRFSLL
jgi:hypothetical protein